MAMSPRSPDLKHNLNVSNGLYGLLLSLGAVGSVISLLVMGRLVHRVGIRKTLYVSATSLYALLASVPHIHTPAIYAIVNIALALSFSAHNIGLHTQTLQRQDESGEMLLPRMHGSWSIGVLVTVASAIVLTSRVSFAWHMDSLMGIIWVSTMILIRRAEKDFVKKSEEPVNLERIDLKRLRRIFTFDKSVIVAFLLGTIIEFASSDWATLVTNQEIGAGKSTSVLAYFAVIVGMIFGRMYFVKLIGYRSEQFWMRLASYAGGGGFILCSQAAHLMADRSKNVAIGLEVLAFLLAGLGTSFMAPLITTIANRRSSLKPSEVVSQLNLSNVILSFFAKLVIAWVAQVTSISIALLIPGIALVLVSRLAYLGNPNRLVSKA